MAPSATESPVTVTQNLKSDVVQSPPETHVHGAEDKSPLEAISHGGLVMPGTGSLTFYYINGGPFGLSNFYR